MRIHRLILRNYRGIDEYQLEFPERGVVVIEGENETGKSSIAEALWLVFEVLGVMAGALFSGLLAGRARIMVEKGPRVSTAVRLLCAFAGGILMAFGAHLARGCTSGQALTGGALLNLGSWAFMLMVFVGGYSVAWFMRWQWR